MASTSSGRQTKRCTSGSASTEPGPSKRSHASKSSQDSKTREREKLKRHKAIEKAIEKAIREASMREFHSLPAVSPPAPAPSLAQGTTPPPGLQSPPPPVAWSPDGDPDSACPGRAEASAKLFGPIQPSPVIFSQAATPGQGEGSLQPIQPDQSSHQDKESTAHHVPPDPTPHQEVASYPCLGGSSFFWHGFSGPYSGSRSEGHSCRNAAQNELLGDRTF